MNETVPTEWAIEIITKGTYGQVVYREDSGAASFDWEFGGGDVIAIIHLEPPSEWNKKYPWAVDRRSQVLDRVITDVIRQKAKTCIACIDEKLGEIQFRERKKADELRQDWPSRRSGAGGQS